MQTMGAFSRVPLFPPSLSLSLSIGAPFSTPTQRATATATTKSTREDRHQQTGLCQVSQLFELYAVWQLDDIVKENPMKKGVKLHSQPDLLTFYSTKCCLLSLRTLWFGLSVVTFVILNVISYS